MSLFSLIGFASPLMLWGLAVLPVIWWLLRYTPPKPVQLMFPPIRLLLGLRTDEETPSKSPWWLTALRMALAALVILALSGPTLRPDAPRAAVSGPLVLVVDNGWASAHDWERRAAAARDEIGFAAESGQPVILAATATAGPAQGLVPQEAARALEKLNGLEPLPFAPDRASVLPRLRQALGGAAQIRVVWLSDGLDYGAAQDFANALPGLAAEVELGIYRADLAEGPMVLGRPSQIASGLEVPVRRAASGGPVSGIVRALALNGRSLGEAEFALGENAVQAGVQIDLPLELRNEIARIEIINAETAAGVYLLDDRWRRRRAGLISGESQELSQPLLSPLYYVERALAPYAELHNVPGANLDEIIPQLIEDRVGMIVMTDVGTLIGDARDELANWVDNGGVLVRFAGPRLADGADELVPVRLRQGGRTLGGALSWSTPQKLGPFDENSPFYGAEVPNEVTVNQQVLAEPDIDLVQKTWAQLADGTPLVTADRRGKGWLILFHVSANTSWSNLPLSGLFVDMLRRITDLASSSGIGAEDTGEATGQNRAAGDYNLPPIRNLDGRGNFISPPPTARPLAASEIDGAKADSEHPPGFYGTPDAYRAINALGDEEQLVPITPLPEAAMLLDYARAEPVDLKPWLFFAALLLLIADTIAVLALTGLAGLRLGRASAAALLLAAGLSLPAGDLRAQENDTAAAEAFAMQATLETRLAYVRTGSAEVDRATEAGLRGLTRILTERTALEPGEPFAVDIARDELAFFPLLYWAIDPNQPAPDAATLAKVDAYMKQGGTILFDTRDQAQAATSTSLGGGGPGMQALRRLLESVDVPRLEPVPADHVLTKAFYLLQAFPGRYDGGPLWVEASTPNNPDQNRPARNSDGVASIMITSNDLAAAWASDANRNPLFPVVPGGERQREMAYRTGVNIVMYTLTGNYKADQVHVPALLERLGQ